MQGCHQDHDNKFTKITCIIEIVIPSMVIFTFFSEAMLAVGLAGVTHYDSNIETGREETYHVKQIFNPNNITITKRDYKPFAVQLTNYPCIQSEIPYSSPKMGW